MKYPIALILTGFLFSCGLYISDPDIEWKIPASDYQRQDFPVSAALPVNLRGTSGHAHLYEIIDGRAVRLDCQFDERTRDTVSWIVPGTTEAGKERQFALKFTRGKKSPGILSINRNDSSLVISKEDKALFHYRYSIMPAPSGQSKLFERSGFIHPLYSPSGEVLTWAQPPDHYHHLGLWNPWTRVSWKGKLTDFWNLGSGQGTVRFREFVSGEAGPVYAEFSAMQDHVAFIPPRKTDFPEADSSREIIVMEEKWTVRVWNINDGYLLDFTSLIKNLMDEPISLDAYRYGGGIGYRATPEWNSSNSAIMTSEGKTRADGDATRARWCWISGDLKGKHTGLLFMSDPGNYDFPEPMRIWPENSNGVGHQYFEFTPIREKAWILEPGKWYSQKYRIWVREGELSPDEAEQQWLQFSGMPDHKISYLSK